MSWRGAGLRPQYWLALLMSFAGVASASLVGTPIAGAACTAPVVQSDNYDVSFGQVLSVPAPGLLANDTGSALKVQTSWAPPDGNPDPSDDVSLFGNATIDYGPSAARPNRQGGFIYTPDPGTPFSGVDEFDYWVTDSCRNEDTATAYVTVVPALSDDHYLTQVDTVLAVPEAQGVVANDQGIDANSVEVDATSSAGGTIVAVWFDGSFDYTPPPGFIGTDSFGYSVSDLNGDLQYNAVSHVDVVAPPGTPTEVVATGGNHTAMVQWSAADGHGTAITTYTITASPGGASSTAIAPTIMGVVSGLTNGLHYMFTVHANTAAGSGAESAASNVVTPDDGIAPLVWVVSPTSTNLIRLSTPIPAKWTGVDDSGIAKFDVQRRVTAWNGLLSPFSPWLNGTHATSGSFAGAYGRSYCFSARAEDGAGHRSGWSASRCTAMPMRSDQLAYSAGWSKLLRSDVFGGIEYFTKSHGASVTRTSVVAKSLYLLVTKCASCGSIQIRWNGTVIKNLSLYSATTLRRQVIGLATFPSARLGIVTITSTGPTGKAVIIEGLGIYNG